TQRVFLPTEPFHLSRICLFVFCWFFLVLVFWSCQCLFSVYWCFACMCLVWGVSDSLELELLAGVKQPVLLGVEPLLQPPVGF
ncbi:mCG1028691, partial [Mus musculus]